MNISDLSKLSFFKVVRYEYENENVCDFRNIPRPHFCMGLLLSGSAVFEADTGESISIDAGNIIFVPITSRYVSKWHGDPDITYISIHFAFEPSCGISENNHFALQKISITDFEAIKNKFIFSLSNYDNEDDSLKMAVLSIFFEIISSFLPILKHNKVRAIDRRIEAAVEYINLHSEQHFCVSNLAFDVGMSVSNFYKLFKSETSKTPIEYKNQVNISRAMRLLKSDECLSVEEISDMLGFESATYFRRVFKKSVGKTPLEYRKSNREL